MKPEISFKADRIAAQHCAELLRGTRKAVDPLKEIGAAGKAIAATLEFLIADLCAGAKVSVNTGEALDIPANISNDRRAEPMLNGMIALGPKEVMAIASVPQRAILSIVDIALGGTGMDCEVPGGKLPLSVEMMFGRFEKIMAVALGEGLGLVEDGDIQIKDPGASLEATNPLAGCKRSVISFEVNIAGTVPWDITFLFPGSALTTLYATKAEATEAVTSPVVPGEGNPLAEPFGAIPLQLRAVLVDMAMPVSKLAQLTPGMVIPVQVARSVPLYAGDKVVAHGAVGDMEDRAALQLTKIIAAKEF